MSMTRITNIRVGQTIHWARRTHWHHHAPLHHKHPHYPDLHHRQAIRLSEEGHRTKAECLHPSQWRKSCIKMASVQYE